MLTPDELSKAQASASKQGAEFEQLAVFLLKAAGWSIESTKTVVNDVEIDIVAINPDGVRTLIETKGSHRGDRPGTRRSDTTKKALFNAYHLQQTGSKDPFAVITSHLPKPGSKGDKWVTAARESGALAWIHSTSGIIGNT